MKIKNIKWRNIFSYGNKEESLDFGDNGTLWQLTGVSGAGKTSLLSIPKLLFFGKAEDDDGKPISVNRAHSPFTKTASKSTGPQRKICRL